MNNSHGARHSAHGLRHVLAAVALIGVGLAAWGLGVHAQDPVPPPQPSFADWLEGLRTEALAKGISEATVTAALATVVEPNTVVVARDRAQPERVQSLDAYVKNWMSPRTVNVAREMFEKHEDLLTKIGSHYGMPPPMLVSVWGLESNFGRFTGSYPTVNALATLAFDPRRSRLFRNELFEALTIIDKGNSTLDEMKGSWAGAMGQPQFMPSSYLKHAVDFDGDGRANIWTSEADVFASIANYLKAAGWVEGERWGREVRLTRATLAKIERQVPMRTSGCGAFREMTIDRSLAQWTALGVMPATGRGALPKAEVQASLVKGQSRYFLVYRNYRAILDYNCSNSYAIAVGLLADQVAK